MTDAAVSSTLKRLRDERDSDPESPAPDEEAAEPVPPYHWNRRHRLFSRFDEGILLDKRLSPPSFCFFFFFSKLSHVTALAHTRTEMWYSVTPECIAQHTAARFAGRALVLDPFAGAGGNAIQFAARRDIAFVVAADVVPARAARCQHNARVYGAHRRLDTLCADARRLPLRPVADAVFLSPPWGGPAYKARVPYPLAAVRPDGLAVFRAAAALAPAVAYYLPVATDAADVRRLLAALGAARPAAPRVCELEFNCIDGVPRTLTVYFGSLVRAPPPPSPHP